jgi:hypothetical protein
MVYPDTGTVDDVEMKNSILCGKKLYKKIGCKDCAAKYF